ncbi:restriction endonuclease subunit S [Hymenobacter aquaticus]|uniref:Restriction endonuclease subunit S n=1 Tax=Hymenobacter aquaticus TaxID=1867101 RepID=A0A4Z0Q4E6_9BACT|nr:restriction endonuclease subunit S [Hymenobacter aquaticus]TGE23951.1 restriction endonuclease subunit S [Hymenobacter aquaticus]
MMNSWRNVKLGDIARLIKDGYTPEPDDDTPYIGLEHIEQQTLRLISCGIASDVTSTKAQFKTGDILFGKLRPYFRKVYRPKFDGICSTDIWVIRARTGVDQGFLFYLLASYEFVDMTAAGSSGTRMPRADWKYLSNSEWRWKLPPLPEQQQIAAILSSLDDKIELNRRMNQTLEQLAQTLFRQWFVAFDFSNAEGQPYRSSGGEMVESELGEIPQGWRVGSLDTIATYLNGLALQKFPADGPDSLPVIKIREMRQGITDATDRASRAVGEKYIIQDGDILFSWSGTLDVVMWSGGEGALNQHLFKVSSSAYPKWFFYLWTLFHLEQFKQIAKDKATTMGHIQRRHLTEAIVTIPNEFQLETMSLVLEPILSRILNNMLESRTLATLRDTLLPQLLSGRLTVRQGEELAAQS